MPALSSQVIQKFDDDGYVIIKNLLPQDLLDNLRKSVNSILLDKLQPLIQEGQLPVSIKDEAYDKALIQVAKKFPDHVPLLLRAELHHPGLYDLFCNEKLLEVVRDLLPEADRIRIFPNYSCRPKLPDFGPHNVVWHQDAGLAADGSPSTTPASQRMAAFGPGRVVNVWTPLVPATPETGCMKFVSGSHKLGIQEHKTLRKYREKEDDVSYGQYAAQIDPDVMNIHEPNAIDVPCDPGDVILFSNLLFHRGGFNSSQIIRWSFDWRYQDAAWPTYREEKGHVIWSRTNQEGVVRSREHWASLTLS